MGHLQLCMLSKLIEGQGLLGIREVSCVNFSTTMPDSSHEIRQVHEGPHMEVGCRWEKGPYNFAAHMGQSL